MNKKIISLSCDKKNKEIISLFPEIPFYGIKGSIHKIEEAKECYYKVLYSDTGAIDPIKKPVPKNKGKNLSSLIDDYHHDLKKYLELNNNKYLDYKSSSKAKLSKRQMKACFFLSSLAVVTSIPVLFLISDLGAILGGVSVFALYKVYDLKTKQDKKEEFMKQYNTYQKALVNYNQMKSDKKKVKETTYTKISSKDVKNEMTRPKVLTLSKEREAI